MLAAAAGESSAGSSEPITHQRCGLRRSRAQALQADECQTEFREGADKNDREKDRSSKLDNQPTPENREAEYADEVGYDEPSECAGPVHLRCVAHNLRLDYRVDET